MTTTELLSKAERWRVGKAETGFAGQFVVPLFGEYWHIVLEEDADWRHLSVAHTGYEKAVPTEVIAQVRNLFFAKDSWVVQLFPPVPPGHCVATVDLWEFLDEDLSVSLFRTAIRTTTTPHTYGVFSPGKITPLP